MGGGGCVKLQVGVEGKTKNVNCNILYVYMYV